MYFMTLKNNTVRKSNMLLINIMSIEIDSILRASLVNYDFFVCAS